MSVSRGKMSKKDFEKKIKEMDQRISGLEEKIEKEIKNIRKQIANTFVRISAFVTEFSTLTAGVVEVASIIRTLSTISRGSIGMLDPLMRNLRSLDDEIERLAKDYSISKEIIERYWMMEHWMTDTLINISKTWSIPFNEIASLFLKHFTKDFLRRTIKVETILSQYGEQTAIDFKKLIE